MRHAQRNIYEMNDHVAKKTAKHILLKKSDELIEDEKKKLFDALSIKGKCWNAEKKCIEDIKPKYTFQPKDWCLMRTASDYAWCLCQFSNMDSESYVAIGGAMHEYCIPYNDETKHILGTTEDAPEKYKTW